MIHELKIQPRYYHDLVFGNKNFEIRKNDRDYEVGDKLILAEFSENKFTGRVTKAKITYIHYGTGEFGLEKGYCVLGLSKEANWIHSKETPYFMEHWTCSNCNHDIIENPEFKNRITGEPLNFVYCPYCGSKMYIGGIYDEA